MITWRMAAAWVTALVVATVLTWQIVGLADSQVGETPVAVAPLLTTNSSGGPSSTPDSTSPSTTGDSAPTTAQSPDPTSRASTTTSPTESSSPSTSSTTSTSPTTPVETWSIRTITTTGGVVVVRYRTGETMLQAATPAPGFSVEVEDDGPDRVKVDFESESDEFRVEARWEGDTLVVDVDD